MKTLRIVLIVLLILYGLGPLTGAIFSLFNQPKMAEMQQLGPLTPGIEKMLLLSGSLMVGQVWLYFSALALLIRNMKTGYMYAVTLGFIDFLSALVIVFSFQAHDLGRPTDYLAILKGLVLLVVALVAFKKSQKAAA